MPRRFEVVAAPVEQRVQEGLKEQAQTALETAKGIFSAIDGSRIGAVNTTRTLLNDDAFVGSVAVHAARLAMPSSLPGFLFVLALFFRFVHWTTLRFTASRAVAKHKLLVVSKKTD
jgi:hypothetical protein